MKLAAAILACLAALCAAPAISASLPVGLSPRLDPDSPIVRSMSALLRDYSEQLPAQRALTRDVPGAVFQTQPWTPQLSAFAQACAARKDDCTEALRAQLEAMQREVESRQGKPRTESDAILLSAMTDLCATWLPFDSAIFRLCNGQQGVALFAADAWLQLGYDELFVAYYDKHEISRTSTIAWLKNQPAEDKIAQGQRQRLESQFNWVISALYWEKTDQLALATQSWLQAFNEGLTAKTPSRIAWTALRLSTLSYRLGDLQLGADWREVADRTVADTAGLIASMGCLYHSERARAGLARSNATPSPGSSSDALAVIRELIERDCRFTDVVIEQALAALLAGRQQEAAAILEPALRECERSGGCALSRHRHLRDLRSIAAARPADRMALAARWLDEASRSRLNGVERQTVWALADMLVRDAQGQPERETAQRLYVALDDQTRLERTMTTGVDSSTLKNLARYDAVSRLRVRETVRQGGIVAFDQTEVLRAQSLLRRLRIKRWRQEFAGVRDDAAQAAYRDGLALHARIRQAMATLERDSSPMARAVFSAMQPMQADIETMLEENLLRELASRKAEAGGASSRKGMAFGVDDLFWHEVNRKMFSSSTTALGPEQAYLSWLAVPGGYVAILATPDPARKGFPEPHRLIQRFIPVSPAMAATITLYRQLLAAGNEAVGGPNNTNAPSGLRLQGVPVWRRTDGSFVASARGPDGAVRVQSASELSEALHRLLLEPLAEGLDGVRQLTISPEGELATLPFETLTRKGVPLVDSFEVSYMQSLAVLEELNLRARRTGKADRPLLSLADPDYGTLPGTPPATDRSLPRTLTATRWQPLPGTRVESTGLVQLFPGAQQWLGQQASRKRLTMLQESDELRRYRVLHFATHGYVDDARSALVLSMADGADQAFLQDTDVLDLRLDSDLVLLSACDTGLGRNVSGEGVVGLPYAFVLAGNSNTLMSLWPVEDKGTAAFITTFMTKAQSGTDLQTALNETKREFAAGRHGKAFADPRVWAAFVQYGIGIRLRR